MRILWEGASLRSAKGIAGWQRLGWLDGQALANPPEHFGPGGPGAAIGQERLLLSQEQG
jgi:hypothetical protein